MQSTYINIFYIIFSLYMYQHIFEYISRSKYFQNHEFLLQYFHNKNYVTCISTFSNNKNRLMAKLGTWFDWKSHKICILVHYTYNVHCGRPGATGGRLGASPPWLPNSPPLGKGKIRNICNPPPHINVSPPYYFISGGGPALWRRQGARGGLMPSDFDHCLVYLSDILQICLAPGG